jgi:hypothetical protein
MRYQNGIISMVGLALAAIVATGAVYSDPFVQASAGQSAGFDALAHELLDDLLQSGEGQSK